MALKLYGSNSLEALAIKMEKNLAEENKDIFVPNEVVTQTRGMMNWLLTGIALREGIAANIQFLSPNDLISRIAGIVGHSFGVSLNSSNLFWMIYSKFQSEEFISQYPDVAAYYLSENVFNNKKRFSLSAVTADLFDQYQIYRNDVIEKWNENLSAQASSWQEYLWKSIKKDFGDIYSDKADVSAIILESLNSPEKLSLIKEKLPYVNLFGISIITPYHINLLMALSQHIEIRFYLLNPAPLQYWQEDVSEKYSNFLRQKKMVNGEELIIGNPLLMSWGKILRDTYSLLFKNENVLNDYDVVDDCEPQTKTLLGKIQNDIFNNAVDEQRNIFKESDLKDGSLTINSCYTIIREIEVLYNYLVNLTENYSLNKNPLSANEILVLVSDIDSYAPYIKAVFDNSPYKFNYNIADESIDNSQTLISTVKELLLFGEENFTGENIMSLIESPVLREKFGLQNPDNIRKIIEKAALKLGISGSKTDDSIFLSWEYGIRKILYSMCMGCEDFNDNDDQYFLCDFDNDISASELINFIYFADILIQFVNEKKETKTLRQWVEYFEELIINFLGNSNDEIDTLLSNLEKISLSSGVVKEKIVYEVFAEVFLQQLSSEKKESRFGIGGITFCSLIPMRSIPFKVVAMLGLNFDNFPRSDSRLSFNLLNTERRKGDRNTKDNDKHLFLETILSAREYLYISYIGQSSNNNGILPPSTLIDELIDYINEKSEVSGYNFICKHPLHNSSVKYGNEPGYINYLNFIPAKPLKIFNAKQTDETLDVAEIFVDELISFFKNPIKYYYNKILSVKLEDADTLLPEQEVFNVDSLNAWNFKNELFKYDGEKDLMKKWIMEGMFPLKSSGEIEYRQILEDVNAVKSTFKILTRDSNERQLNINLEIEGNIISGTISNIFSRKYLPVIFSKKITAKHYVVELIKFYVAVASGEADSMVIIKSDGKISSELFLNSAEAEIQLTALLKIFKLNNQKMVCFNPELFSSKVLESYENYFNHFRKRPDNFGFNDKYVLLEQENNFFEGEDKFSEFKEIEKIFFEHLTKLK